VHPDRSPRPIRATAALLVAMAMALIAGCSSTDVRPLGEDPDIQAAQARVKTRDPLPKLAIAPVAIDYALAFDLTTNPGKMPISLDRRELTARLADAIATYAGAGRPAILEDETKEGAPRPREELCGDAALAGAEILVLPRLTRCDVFFDKRNGSWPWNVILWLYLWIPAWFVADEDYGVEARLELTYVAVGSERVIHRSEVTARHVESLDDFERGWDFFGVFRIPGALDADQLRDVEDLLWPHGRRALEKAVVLELSDGLPGVLADPKRRLEIEEADIAVAALLVGVSSYQDDARIAAPPGASNDVHAMGELLVESMGVPAKNVLRLEGRAATRLRIEAAIDGHLAKRARPQDTVVVYFSGVGAAGPSGTASPEGYLLPHDARADDLAGTAVALSKLCARLATLPARRALVIIDAGMGPSASGTRSLRGAVAPSGPLAASVLERASVGALGKEVAVLAAVGGGAGLGHGEDALDLPEAKRGLLSYLLCEGARGRADADASGDVSTDELAAYVARHAAAQAGLEGVTMHPALYRGGKRVAIDAPRGGAPWLPRARDVKGL